MHISSLNLIKRIIVTLLLIFIGACSQDTTVKLGYVGGLTGRVADLGIAGRDGVILAVEQANAAAGINGTPIELIIKDDRQDTDVAIKVDQELIDAKVAAIIGHMTSAMSVAAVPLTNRQEMLMISPTTSTNLLSEQDDFFFRVYPPSSKAARELARYAYERLNMREIVAIYDIRNRAHTESFFRHFKAQFEELGGQIPHIETFASGNANFRSIAAQIDKTTADGVFINTNALDAAMLSQQLEQQTRKRPIVTSEWPMTEEILNLGGSAVEGAVFIHTFNRESTTTAFQNFKKAFQARFRYAPGFASTHAYDAAQVIITALRQNADPKQLPATLKAMGDFQGLQTTIRFDQYGDPARKLFFTTIRQGKFQMIHPD